MSVCALYRHFDAAGDLLYVGISTDALKRLMAHSRHASWYNKITTVTIEHFPSRRAASAAEIAAIRNEHPKHNTAWTPKDDRLERAVVAAQAGTLKIWPKPMFVAPGKLAAREQPEVKRKRKWREVPCNPPTDRPERNVSMTQLRRLLRNDKH